MAIEISGYVIDAIADAVAERLQKPKIFYGHWIAREFQNKENGEIRKGMECSACGNKFFRYDISNNTEDFIPNYCPYCGSKMSKRVCGNG